jgi:predicted transcriptional regulator
LKQTYITDRGQSEGCPVAVKRLAALLGKTPKTIRNHIHAGKIHGHKFGQWIIPASEFNRITDEISKQQ